MSFHCTVAIVVRQKRVNLEFDQLTVTIGKKDILRSVFGASSDGQTLAVLGPSGMTALLVSSVS